MSSPKVGITSSSPSLGSQAFTSAAMAFSPPVRGVHIDTGTSINLQRADGSTHLYTVIAGHFYPYASKAILAGGDATGSGEV